MDPVLRATQQLSVCPPPPQHGCMSVVNRRFLMVLGAAENTPSWASHITLVISGL